MISFSRTTASSADPVIIQEDKTSSDFFSRSTRISRTKTLDGSCVIVNSGQYDCDRTFNIKAKINATQETQIITLYEEASAVVLSCKAGCYLGYISSLNTNKGALSLKIYIEQDLTDEN